MGKIIGINDKKKEDQEEREQERIEDYEREIYDSFHGESHKPHWYSTSPPRGHRFKKVICMVCKKVRNVFKFSPTLYTTKYDENTFYGFCLKCSQELKDFDLSESIKFYLGRNKKGNRLSRLGNAKIEQRRSTY